MQPQNPTPASNQVPKVEILLEEVVKKDASDLHLQVGMPAMLRIDGALVPYNHDVLDEKTVEELVFSLLDDDQKQVLLRDKEFDFSFAFGDLGRFRVNAFHERGNLAAAMRLIPNKIRTVEDLGLPEVVNKFTDYPRGLVLVTGPTGSGKSTTLAAMVDRINGDRAAHIITVEDPIEYTHKSKKSLIVQREVHYDTFSFAAALRSALREDPDVVLIGEMRDLETIAAAITIAETGHLVLATLHTNSASQSVDRMIDVFPPHQQPQVRAQLGNMLQAIVSQRLIPALGGGRIAAAEILVATPAVRNIIREGKSYQLEAVIQTGAEYGMQSMDRTLVNLIHNGTISYDEARNYAVDLDELDRLMRS
ncbi:MAG TPA: type IV pilus twitching motility protein PilT [Candidatus Saccharimonadales bacterium]|nr:type IV pilus twitching motility protein PilT [Candidatus Saccharimonadales bacterium]